MATCNQILEALWKLAPVQLKEDWDNVGLLCGRAEREVGGVLVALDPTAEVAHEAVARGCELVVTHHPITFGTKSVTDTDTVGRNLLAYLENNLSLICMHTNLDCAAGGVNDALAQRLALVNVRVLFDGKTAGIVRIGEVPEQPLPMFVKRVKQLLRCEGLRYTDAGKPVKTVAVGGGACGELIPVVLQNGCDTFVTADVKYHAFREARERGLNLLDAGHFQTENPVCAALRAYLAAAFPGIGVICSEKHADVIKFAD